MVAGIRLSRIPLVLASLALIHCVEDLAELSVAQVTCETDLECPGGLVCGSEGRCFDPTAADFVQGSVTIEPALVGLEMELRVEFTVDEPLAGIPEIVLRDASGVAHGMTVSAADDANGYVGVLTTSRSMAEGRAVVVVSLVDEDQNRRVVTVDEATTLDLTPPDASLDVANIAFESPNTRLLRTVDALAPGGGVRVRVVTSEPLRPGAELVLQTDPPTLLSNVGTTGTVETFSGSLDAVAAVQSEVDVVLDGEDLAGNRCCSSPIGSLPVDNVPPSSPNVDRLVMLRDPYQASTVRPPLRLLTDPPGARAAEPEAVVIVLDGAGLDAIELGRGRAGSDGVVDVEMFVADRSDFYVASVDLAGNASPVVPVERARWLAGLEGKIAGDSVLNPHQFLVRSWFGPELEQADTREPPDLEQALSAPDSSGIATRGSGAWFAGDNAMPRSPGAFSASRTTYDQRRGEAVVFPPTVVSPQRWRPDEWRDESLRDLELDGNPERLVQVAHDPRSGVIYGLDPEAALWRYENRSWKRLETSDVESDGEPSAIPSPYYETRRLVYDGARAQLLLLSLDSNPITVWRWAGGSWESVCEAPQCASPPARAFAMVSYDAVHERLNLYGGAAPPTTRETPLDDHWQWDGTTWSQVSAETPPARLAAVMSADPTSGRTLLLGGCPSLGTICVGRALNDQWLWDGTEWQQLCDGEPADDVCDPLLDGREVSDATAWFDSQLGTWVVGENLIALPGVRDLGYYAWRERGWFPVTHAQAEPTALPSEGAAAFDPTEGGALGFGGVTTAPTATDEVWLWAGRWSLPDVPPSPRPPASARHTLDYHPRDGVSYLFGGCPSGNCVSGSPFGHLWEYRGGDGTWTERCDGVPASDTCSATPPARHRHGAAVLDDALVIYGGREQGTNATAVLSDTWVWSGDDWVEGCDACAETPGPRLHPAMTGHGGTSAVLFAGELGKASNDTWVWDGAQWEQRCDGDDACTTRPSPVAQGSRPRLFHAPSVGQSLLVFDRELWLWDGTDWREQPLTASPAGWLGPEAGLVADYAFFDSVEQQVVLAPGPESGSADGGRVWILDPGFDRSPGHHARVFYAFAGVDVLPSSITIRWIAGGRGYATDGTPLTGATLRVWDQGYWRALESSTSASPESPEALVATISAPEQIRRVLTGGAQALDVSVVSAPNGGQLAEVVSDYVQVEFAYRSATP